MVLLIMILSNMILSNMVLLIMILSNMEQTIMEQTNNQQNQTPSERLTQATDAWIEAKHSDTITREERQAAFDNYVNAGTAWEKFYLDLKLTHCSECGKSISQSESLLVDNNALLCHGCYEEFCAKWGGPTNEPTEDEIEYLRRQRG